MTQEQKYTEQMRQLGLYKPAFAPAIHTLCMMEREHRRTLKAWKDDGSDPASKLYGVIAQQRRDILTHRDALGLTPQALRRLKPVIAAAPEETVTDRPPTVLELVRGKHAKEA